MRLKTVLSAVFFVFLIALPGSASIICPTTGTYQDLINSNGSGGCTISPATGGVLTFSGFTFTASGAGTPAANQMGYTLDNPGVSIGTGQSIYGFEFNPGLAVIGSSGTPNAIQDILLTYTVVATGTFITSVHLLENEAVTGSGVAQVSENLTFCIASDPNPALGTCRLFGGNPLKVSSAGGVGIHNDLLGLLNWTSMTVSKDINVSSGSLGSTASISQVRDAVDISAPEPATYGVMSLGLLVLGYFRFRRTTRTS